VVAQGDAIHILNPISPAFTSSMDIAETVVREHFERRGTDRRKGPA
jgi:L-2-hydroxyglutarate oxidase